MMKKRHGRFSKDEHERESKTATERANMRGHAVERVLNESKLARETGRQTETLRLS